MELKPVHQTLFGGINAPRDQRGNCFPACIASMLGVSVDSVPHFYGTDSQDDGKGDAEWHAICDWLTSKGWSILAYEWPINDYSHRALKGALVIMSGVSPRFPDSQHAVIGQLDGIGGWTLVHDPHPDGAGIIGDPLMVELVIPQVRAPKAVAA